MRIQRRVLILAAAAFLMLSGAPALEAQPLEFGISPGDLELVPWSGGTASGTLLVMNRSPRRVRFRVRVQDMYIRPSGELHVLEGTSLDWSLVKLTRLMPQEFDLDPQQQMPVRISVTVPADARGGRYGAVVVSPSPVLQTGGPRGTFSIVIPKLAARLLVPVRGTEVVRGAIVNMLAAARAGGRGAEIKVVFRNSGNVHVRASGEAVILNESGQQVAKLTLQESLVLPASVREFKLSWEAKSLDPGTYTVRAVIDYGADVLVSGEVSFTYRKP